MYNDNDISKELDLKEKFQSTAIQQQNQTYVEHLYEQLNEWKSGIDEQIGQIIEKTNEITQYYDQYCQEINGKHENINTQIENQNLSSDINEQIENLNTYCQSNKIEKRIHLNTEAFTKNELKKKIQLEYMSSQDILLKTTEIPLKPIIKERRESIHSISSSSTTPSISMQMAKRSSKANSKISDHQDDITLKSLTDQQDDITLKSLSDHQDDITLKSLSDQQDDITLKSLSDHQDDITLKSSSDHQDDITLKSLTDHQDDIALKSLSDHVDEKSFHTLNKPTTITNGKTPKRSTKLYAEKHKTIIPVLIKKNRELYNEKERITEYSIDSIAITQRSQQQKLTNAHNVNDDTVLKLVHAYKVLIREENDYRPLSTSSDNKEQEKSNVNKLFNLQQFHQTNHSTVMFKKCETAYNCLSSSTKRNELLIYNSKLKVLMALKHEHNKKNYHQLFIQWPKNVSSNISDITYCENIDNFLISTYDTCHIYLFNRDLLSIYNLGKLTNHLPLRRFHCDQQTVYCILGDNYLVEFQLNDQYKNLKFIQQIKLFNPINLSQDEGLYLLDVTCDNNYLIVIYSNERDEIHLQSIHRETKELHCDFIIDDIQPINQVYIRIESTNYNGNFIYLNGKQQILKAINLINEGDDKITSTMHRQSKPTNTCCLKDDRLVILHEYPHYLSIHALNNR
ncbi:unnamed protein product [Rotaria sp. Silwood1]|nr:unnamed protein product [Rotaria sp. Silwood1]CAF4644939.1 unnamed protein product [Rotaria sp. Silwood1]